jgi:hypothetical protein
MLDAGANFSKVKYAALLRSSYPPEIAGITHAIAMSDLI